jgi:uncharacterized ferredoxin-like protein
MAITALTAPTSVGEDFVMAEVLEGKPVAGLGRTMIDRGKEMGIAGSECGGQSVIDTKAVVLPSIKDADVMDLTFAACAAQARVEINTFEGELAGPNYALRHLGLSIALRSAVKTASLLNVDDRIMYRAGVLARALAHIDTDFVMAIPLSDRGKMIFFDRAPKR